ncbi:transposase [Treponema primitia]|uniref:transposase n=1 Tax=Treponema primitia TaxID=88058 RepID=UPI00398183E7
MSRYKTTGAEYGQGFFLEVNLAEQLLPGTFDWTVNQIVENNIDCGKFDILYKNDQEGRPAINPRALLKLVLYGYSRGILSSRKLENLARTNITAKALTGDISTDHATIAAFVSGHSEEMKEIFTEVLLVCNELELIKGDMFALDGCRLPSNASKEWSGTHENLEKKQKRFEKQVGRLMEKHQNNDLTHTDDEKDRLQGAIERFEKKAAYIKDFLKTAETRLGVSGKEVQSNVTDNESAKIKELTGKEKPLADTLLLADTNYFSEDNLKIAQEQGVKVLIPDPHFRTREEGFKNRKGHVKEEDKKFTVQEFTYNEKDDTYICPCGKVLPYQGVVKLNRNTGKVYRMKQGGCTDCPLLNI